MIDISPKLTENRVCVVRIRKTAKSQIVANPSERGFRRQHLISARYESSTKRKLRKNYKKVQKISIRIVSPPAYTFNGPYRYFRLLNTTTSPLTFESLSRYFICIRFCNSSVEPSNVIRSKTLAFTFLTFILFNVVTFILVFVLCPTRACRIISYYNEYDFFP